MSNREAERNPPTTDGLCWTYDEEKHATDRILQVKTVPRLAWYEKNSRHVRGLSRRILLIPAVEPNPFDTELFQDQDPNRRKFDAEWMKANLFQQLRTHGTTWHRDVNLKPNAVAY